jgi:hypothetical protein
LASKNWYVGLSCPWNIGQVIIEGIDKEGKALVARRNGRRERRRNWIMRPTYWRPPIELSATEQMIVKRIRRGKLFVFLRQHRHEVFDETLQRELASLYHESQRGQPPVPPALLALATILQAYTRVSDEEVIEASIMDRRWQLVLDCADTEEPPFSKGTLVAFRKRLIETNIAQRLVERTIEVARETGAFGSASLRAALDGSSLWCSKNHHET